MNEIQRMNVTSRDDTNKILLAVALLKIARGLGTRKKQIYRYFVFWGLALAHLPWFLAVIGAIAVPVNQVIAMTFGIGSALVAASGIMWALRYHQIQPIMGVIPGFKAFIAAVFGGIDSIPGTVIGN